MEYVVLFVGLVFFILCLASVDPGWPPEFMTLDNLVKKE